MPVFAASTSIASVSRTFSTVPAGRVIGAGFLAGSGAAAGGGAALRGVNSREAISSTGNSATEPFARRIRADFGSAPMNNPSTVLPERSFTRSADASSAAATAIAKHTATRAGLDIRISLLPRHSMTGSAAAICRSSRSRIWFSTCSTRAAVRAGRIAVRRS